MNILDYVKIETSTVEDGNMSFGYGEKDEVRKSKSQFWVKKSFRYDTTYQLRTDMEKFDNVNVVDTVPKKFTVVQNTDALITNSKDIVLALLTADCLQITAYDTKNKILALIHAGFRWQDAGIIDKTFKMMNETFKSTPTDILVHLGNCISPEYYRWDRNILKNTTKDSWIRKCLTKDDHLERPYKIDLRKAAILNLEDLGVLEDNILDNNIDCYTNENYFSHVRSIHAGEKEGRHVTLVQMK